MASKHEFGFQRKQSESKIIAGANLPGNPGSAASYTSDNVDTLVSEFLTELNSISKEIGAVQLRVEKKTSPNARLEMKESVIPNVRVDVKEIERELEKSLLELERLKSLKVTPPNPAPEITPTLIAELAVEREKPLPAFDSGRQNKDHNPSIDFKQPSRTRKSFLRHKGIFLGLFFILILVFSFFYYLVRAKHWVLRTHFSHTEQTNSIENGLY
jgi:hypothetical protein